MTNFEAAVELSLNNWVASLPTEFDLPEPTEAYKKNTAKIIDKMRGDHYHRLTRNTARAILIAAIILAIATVTLAATVGREFIVKKFSNYSTYSVVDNSDVESVDEIKIGYIPKGFELDNNEITDNTQFYNYSNNDKWFNLYKTRISDDITFDTEYENSESLIINGVEGVYYQNPNSKSSGVVWNNGDYIFSVQGNISKEELIKIAEKIT